jgi:hypothetical protein
MIHAQAQATDDTKTFHEIHLLPKSKQTPLKQQNLHYNKRKRLRPQEPITPIELWEKGEKGL